MASVAHRGAQSRVLRRQVFAAATVAALLTSLILLLTGGGSHGLSAASSPDAAAATVQAFGQALHKRDFGTMCNLFTDDARAAEGGPDCASTLSGNAALLQNPRVKVNSLAVRGRSAAATISVRQDHQPVMTEVLQLTRQGDQFKISAVTSPGG